MSFWEARRLGISLTHEVRRISSRAHCALVSHHASACILPRLGEIQNFVLMIVLGANKRGDLPFIFSLFVQHCINITYPCLYGLWAKPFAPLAGSVACKVNVVFRFKPDSSLRKKHSPSAYITFDFWMRVWYNKGKKGGGNVGDIYKLYLKNRKNAVTDKSAKTVIFDNEGLTYRVIITKKKSKQIIFDTLC